VTLSLDTDRARCAGPRHTVQGVLAIPSTLIREDGEVDIPSFRQVLGFCVECGAHGLVFPVNASEFTSLSDAERLTLAEVLVEQNDRRLRVIAGVAGASEEAAARFGKHVRDTGADGVTAMPHYVRRGEFPERVVFDYYRKTSDAARIPVFTQNHVPPVGTNTPAGFISKPCR